MTGDRAALIKRLRAMQKSLRAFGDQCHSVKDQVERTNDGWLHMADASISIHAAAKSIESAIMYWGRNGAVKP